MKKHLLSTLFISAVSGIIAQPTFNHADVAPLAGDIYTAIMSGVNPSPGSAGANQTWNLSSMTQTAVLSNSITSMSSSQHAASFPNANLQSYDGTNYAFLNTTGSKFFHAGFIGGGLTVPYSDQEEWMQFPMTYNTQFTDNMAANFTANSIPVNRTGTTTVTYDGYGTLITPAGTYSNAARFLMVQVTTDATQFASTTSTVSSYMWRILGERFAIALVSTAVTPFSNTTYSWYRNVPAGTVGLSKNQAAGASFSAYPNPANEILTVEASQSLIRKVDVLDLQGRVVQSALLSDLKSTVEVDVRTIPDGIYVARIGFENGDTSVKKVIVSH